MESAKPRTSAASLTHQLLAFSRRQPLFSASFSINDSVKNLQKMLQRVIGEHIQIQTQLKLRSADSRPIRASSEQVLLNLCVNARDAIAQRPARSASTQRT